MLKGVILDFDGLILDTEVVIYEIYRDWFKENFNYDLSMEKFSICVGANSEVLFKELERETGKLIDRDKIDRDVGDEYEKRIASLPMNPGIEDLILESKELGFKLALATSSKFEKPNFHLRRLGVYKYFDAIVTADDVERVKPFPDLFLKALEKLNIKGCEAVIFEDSKNGLIAGKKAGVDVIVVPNRVTEFLDFDGYYKLIENLEEFSLRQIIKE